MFRRAPRWLRIGLVLALLGGSLVMVGAAPAEAASSVAWRAISGERVTMSGELPTGGVRTVKLQSRSGSKWRTVDTGETNDNGEFELTSNRLRKTTLIRVYAPKQVVDGWVERSYTSGSYKIAVVKQSASLSLTGPFLSNEEFTARVKASPVREGRPLQLQVKKGKHWVVVAEGKSDAGGAADLAFAPGTAGYFTYRTVAKAWRGTSSRASGEKRVRVRLGLPRVTTINLADVKFGEPYSVALQAAGGATPYSWAVTGLPEGLSLASASGVVSGTPTAHGTFGLQITLTDKMNRTAAANLDMKVTADPLQVITTKLPDAKFPEPYSVSLQAVGGARPYLWAVTGLPGGLSLDSATGRVSGTPTEYGTFGLQLTVLDGLKRTATANLDLNVTADPLQVTNVLSAAKFREPYSVSLQAAGGAGPYLWAVTGLPGGLSLDSATGRVSGTPTEYGRFGVWVNVMDKMNQTATLNLDLVVNANARQIAAGDYHTCALTDTARVECWGANSNGQLGDGTSTGRSTPVQVSGLSGVTQIAAGDSHTCALTDTGSAKCWGRNWSGQLGDGTNTGRSTPVPVSGLTSGITQIAPGGAHTCALTDSGGVECWGANSNGQLGDGTAADRSTPVQVSGLTFGVTQIAAGDYHTCALTDTGNVKCWGANWNGRLGDGTATDRSTPVQLSGLTGVTQIAAAGGHTCALTDTGSVRCWGYNGEGQLGDGTAADRSTPVQVSGLSGVTQIAVGGGHTCARTGAGSVYCWGAGDYGQLGWGSNQSQATPVQVWDLAAAVTQISAGGAHTCALTDTASVRCWGYNEYGQVGNGTTTRQLSPEQVIGFG